MITYLYIFVTNRALYSDTDICADNRDNNLAIEGVKAPSIKLFSRYTVLV